MVLDVGAGTGEMTSMFIRYVFTLPTDKSPMNLAGVLSFFALQAGARKVYSIEASNMATYCRKLVKENNYSDKMEVIVGKVEEVRKWVLVL